MRSYRRDAGRKAARTGSSRRDDRRPSRCRNRSGDRARRSRGARGLQAGLQRARVLACENRSVIVRLLLGRKEGDARRRRLSSSDELDLFGNDLAAVAVVAVTIGPLGVWIGVDAGPPSIHAYDVELASETGTMPGSLSAPIGTPPLGRFIKRNQFSNRGLGRVSFQRRSTDG